MYHRINTKHTLTYTVLLTLTACRTLVYADTEAVNIAGDFTIGAMFPIHTLTEKGSCGSALNDQNGIQNLEAMLFSLQKANEQVLKDIDISLGAMAFDSCDSDTVALDKALQFVKFQSYMLESVYTCADGTRPKTTKEKLLGVIGGATSSVSIQLANFLRLFKVPQISYSATSPELSDTSRYDYFMRTAASDKYQARAIVEILKTFDWRYVIGIYEDTSYGDMGFTEIKAEAARAGICVAKSYKVNRYFQSQEDNLKQLQSTLNDTLQFSNTDDKIVVILYAAEDIANSIFQLVADMNLDKKFIWIGSDAWTGRKINEKYQHVVDQALGIQPKVEKIKEFDDYFKNLTVQNHKTNPWFGEYWQQTFRCRVQTTSAKTTLRPTKHKYCTGNERFSEENGTYKRNLNTYAVMDAVYAFAYALKSIHKDICGSSKGICTNLKLTEAEHLKQYLQKVNFTDLAGLGFQFIGNSGPARYSVMQYLNTANGYSWREVDDCQVSNDTAMDDGDWFYSLQNLISAYRPSYCSLPCKKGEATQLHKNKCCWNCVPCQKHQYLEVDNRSCVNCPLGKKANNTQSGCEDIPITRVDVGWIVTSIVLTCIGVIFTCLIAGLFYWQRDTPLIMASGKELSFVLLLGILMSYLSTFTFVAYPTPLSCGATRSMLGLSYTVVYAAILVKTNRIYRVFNINTSKPKKVRYIGAKSQLLITLAIVSVEIVALVMWLIFDPSEETFVYPTPTEKIILCEDAMDFAYLGSLAYPFVLMILCVYYAFRTRKTPDGFNETRYITFGSYSFCVLWIAFTSIYFSVHDNTIRIVSLCFASTINATVTLITLFITKTYVVLLRPQKNTRENVMSRRRTHSYDTVNINNLSNLSRMASAVSTWHSVNTRFDSEDSQHQTITINQKPKFTNHLSVSVISVNNVGQSDGSMYSNVSSTSAPPDHRHLSHEEARAPFKQSSTDLGDERLKQFLEAHDKHENNLDLQHGIGQMVPRRSLRSFKSRRKRRRTVKRTRSLDGGNDLTVPDIVVTRSSQEDNSVTVVNV